MLFRSRKDVDAAVPMETTPAPAPCEEEHMSIDASPAAPPTLPSNIETPESVFTLGDDEEEVDFEDTPTRVGMDVNMVY